MGFVYGALHAGGVALFAIFFGTLAAVVIERQDEKIRRRRELETDAPAVTIDDAQELTEHLFNNQGQ